MKANKNKLLTESIKVKRNLPVNYVAADIEFYEDYRTYETNNCYLKSINNALVTFDSIVYKTGILVDESLFSKEHKSYYRLRYLLKTFFSLKKIILNPDKKYLLSTDSESAGHFHWLTEVLPRLLSLKEFCGEFVLMLPDKPYIRNVALESLRIANLNFEDIFFMKESEYYAVKDLHYVSKISRSGQMHDELMQELNTLFISSEKTRNKRIYISREKARFRKILNEKEFTETLKNYRFDVIYSEDLNFSEQVEIFSSCETLLGIHGAGLANCLFMNPGSNLIEIRKNEINLAYWHLADCLEHKYYYYNGIPDSEKSIIGRGCNLTIPVKDFEEKILQNLEN
jgi:hypothetical protein